MTTDHDEALVARAQKAPTGDTRAFERLVERHQDRILTNCRFLSGSADDAQDLAQEVFVKAFFHIGRFEGRSRFGSWLQRIKINHCLNFLRKRKGRAFLDVQDAVAETEPELRVAPEAERDLQAADQKEKIRCVLDRMPETLRVPLIMCDLDGLSYQEIADDLGIGLSAVKMRIKRAREEFRRLFEARATDEGVKHE